MESDPVLIGEFGSGRNGSTLILRLIDGSPGVYVHPIDCNFLAAWNDLTSRGKVRDTVRKNALTSPLRYLHMPIQHDLLLKFYGSHTEEMRDLLQKNGLKAQGKDPWETLSQETYSLTEFIPAFLRAHALWIRGTGHCTHLFFKSIETPYIHDYLKVFPAMRFVHILRNPEAVFHSAKRSHRMKDTTILHPGLSLSTFTVFIHRRWIPHARYVLKNRNSEKHMLCRYEDVCSFPQEEVRAIAAHCGFRPPEKADALSLLNGHGEYIPPNTSSPHIDTPKTVLKSTDFLYKEKVLTPREKLRVTFCTWDLARKLGYFYDRKKPSRLALLLSWISVDIWESTKMNKKIPLRRLLTGIIRQRLSVLTEIMYP